MATELTPTSPAAALASWLVGNGTHSRAGTVIIKRFEVKSFGGGFCLGPSLEACEVGQLGGKGGRNGPPPGMLKALRAGRVRVGKVERGKED